jgi:rhomboid protease GluP
MWALLTINVVVFLLLEITGGSTSLQNLVRWGAKVGPQIADGDYWRLFTPMFLHIGFYHLLTNSIGIVIFGKLVETYFGTRTFVTIYLAAGIFGNILSYAVVTNGIGAGASGAVFGILAAYGVFLFKNRKQTGKVDQSSLGGVFLIVGLNLVFGFSVTGVDNWAHIGGLVSGSLIAYRLSPTTVLIPSRPPGVYGGLITDLRPALVRTSTLRLTETIILSGVAIVLMTWVIGNSYPVR